MAEPSVEQLIAEAQAQTGPLAQAGDWAGVVRVAASLTRRAPSAPEGWLMQSYAFTKMGHYAEACDATEAAFRLQTPLLEEIVSLARLALFAQDFERADRALARAEADAPADPSVLAARALYLTYMGRTEEAESSCLKSIEADPERIDAWPQLSLIRNGRLTLEEEKLLRALLNGANTPPQAKISAGFVLAHSLDARGDIDAAFIEYARANKLAFARNGADGYVFDRAAQDAHTQRIIKLFQGVRGSDAEHEITPLFIVGAPRSGSTLVESVFAAHTKVAAGGEFEMMPRLFGGWLRGASRTGQSALRPEERQRFADAYFDGAPARAGATHITDKNLLNIEAVGFIAEIFPRAKIVHVRRAPMEAGLGIYRQKFRQFWPWTTRLEDIGARLGQIAQLVRHWEERYPERFMTIQYETFTDDFETGARCLLDFCELGFEPQCLDFQKADRAVVTMSSAQVREPVKKRSGKAAAYAAHLEPLRAALEKAGVDLETGALNA